MFELLAAKAVVSKIYNIYKLNYREKRTLIGGEGGGAIEHGSQESNVFSRNFREIVVQRQKL